MSITTVNSDLIVNLRKTLESHKRDLKIVVDNGGSEALAANTQACIDESQKMLDAAVDVETAQADRDAAGLKVMELCQEVFNDHKSIRRLRFTVDVDAEGKATNLVCDSYAYANKGVGTRSSEVNRRSRDDVWMKNVKTGEKRMWLNAAEWCIETQYCSYAQHLTADGKMGGSHNSWLCVAQSVGKGEPFEGWIICDATWNMITSDEITHKPYNYVLPADAPREGHSPAPTSEPHKATVEDTAKV